MGFARDKFFNLNSNFIFHSGCKILIVFVFLFFEDYCWIEF